MNNQLSLFEEKPKCILMSLMEDPFNRMLSGVKKYEFRTRYLKEETDAYIYISRTKKSIVAKIKFGKPIIGNSHDIASLSGNIESYNWLMNYFKNDIGYALPVEKIELINEISLDELRKKFPGFVVPQSYYILDKKPDVLEYIENQSR